MECLESILSNRLFLFPSPTILKTLELITLDGAFFTIKKVAACCRLYAVGGRDGSSCLRSVESFDPHFNTWSACAPMSKRRGCVGVGVCNSGYLYAIGGHDAPASNALSKLTDTVERLVSGDHVIKRGASYSWWCHFLKA